MALGAQVIRGGEASVNAPQGFNPNASDDGIGRFLDNLKERRKEGQDFYKSQVEEMESLNALLKNTKGSDFKFMQENIVSARDELKELYKTTDSKNYNSPEFQYKVLQLKDKLSSQRNVVDTFADLSGEAIKYGTETPFVNSDAVKEYVREQLSLPPGERDQNILNTVQNDPKYYNPLAFVSSTVKGQPSAKAVLDRNGDKIEVSYNTSLYKQVGNKLVFDPSKTLVDTLMADKKFQMQMMNMIPGAEKMVGTGNSDMTADEIRAKTVEYLQSVTERMAPSEDFVHAKPVERKLSAREQADFKLNEQARALFENTATDPIEAVRTLSVGEGEKGYHSFTPVYEDGEFMGYQAKFRNKVFGDLENDTDKFFPVTDFAQAKNMMLTAGAYSKVKGGLTENLPKGKGKQEAKEEMVGPPKKEGDPVLPPSMIKNKKKNADPLGLFSND